jgi:predicted RNA binding protein YcfA (HicA-like mRNA interferase family)
VPSLPLVRPVEVIKAFERHGWKVARRRGSHVILTKPGNPATLSIPDHELVARGTLRTLITRSGLTIEEFLSAL